MTTQLITAAQEAALPLNSTLYLPTVKEAIPTIKTRIAFRSIFIGRASPFDAPVATLTF
jgi:hypothetical protein